MSQAEPVNLLLTGATGSVGCEVLRSMQELKVPGTITCLTRRGGDMGSRERWLQAMKRHGIDTSTRAPQLMVREGDLERPDLGLDPTSRAYLYSTITHVLHCAALLEYQASYAKAHETNVVGTQRVLELSQNFVRLRLFGYVSTLFVVGAKSGRLPVGASSADGFNNVYERTKLEAEAVVHASSLPTEIYRLSLLMGRAQDGYVHRYLESHMLMDALCRGRCRRLPGAPTASIDMLPTDYSVRALLKLFLGEHRARGGIWSLAAGDAAPTSQQIFELICAALHRQGQAVPPPPIYIEDDEFSAIMGCDDPTPFGISDAARIILVSIGPYVLRPKIFEHSADPACSTPPSAEEWLPQVLDYCIRNRWGRRRLPIDSGQDARD